MLDAFGPGLEWVVLVCGENDIAEGVSVSNAFSRFKSNVEKAVSTGARVLYMGTKPEPSTKSLWDEYRKYDALIRGYATSLGGFLLYTWLRLRTTPASPPKTKQA